MLFVLIIGRTYYLWIQLSFIRGNIELSPSSISANTDALKDCPLLREKIPDSNLWPSVISAGSFPLDVNAAVYHSG